MKLYIITGVPGAGKSTLAKSMIADGLADEHFEADMWMVKDNEYCFMPSKLGYCHKLCQGHVEVALQDGYNVIVSNTTLTIREAKPYIEIAQKLGAEIEIIHLTTKFGSIHNVPEEKMEQMEKKRQLFKLEDF